MKNRKLYPDQKKASDYLFNGFKKGKKKLGLVALMGWGKSTTCAHIMRRIQKHRPSRFLVLVPQTSIKGSFIVDMKINSLEPLANIDTKESTTATILNLLEGNIADGRLVVATHAAATKALAHVAELDAKLDDLVLIVDEAHHTDKASINKIAQFTDAMSDLGACVLKVTATPYDTKNQPIFDEAWHVFEQGVVECFLSGRFPKTLDVQSTQLQGLDVNATKPKPKELDAMCDQMLYEWELAGRPKAIFNLQPKGFPLAHNRIAKRLTKAIRSKGVRVHNSIGPKRKKSTLALLERERAKDKYQDSEVDIILAVGRFDEGTDWKFCSYISMIGVPGSPRLRTHRAGRTLRSKQAIEDTPIGFQDKAMIRFFLPDLSSQENESEFLKAHGMDMFVFFASVANWRIGTTFLKPLLKKNGQVRAHAQEAFEALNVSDEDMALGTKLGLRAWNAYDHGGTFIAKEFFTELEHATKDQAEHVVLATWRAALELTMASAPETFSKQVEAGYQRLIESLLRSSRASRKQGGKVSMKALIQKKFMAFVEGVMADVDVDPFGTFDEVSGVELGKWSSILRRTYDFKSLASLDDELIAYHRIHDAYPKLGRYHVGEGCNEWWRWNGWLQAHHGTTLKQYIYAKYDQSIHVARKDRTKEELRTIILKFEQKNGRPPMHRDLKEWAAWDCWIVRKFKITLHQFVSELLDLKPKVKKGRSVDSVKRDIDSFYREFGRYPKGTDKGWSAHSQWLKANIDMTLPQFLESEYSFSSKDRKETLKSIRIDSIRIDVENFFSETGKYPKKGLSKLWRRHDGWLSRHYNMTLAQYIQTNFKDANAA